MHIDFSQLAQIGAWIGVGIGFVRQWLGLGKDVVDIKKTLNELKETNTKKTSEDDATYAERMAAAAEFAKAYVEFGFLKYLYYTSMTVIALYILRWAYEMWTRQER